MISREKIDSILLAVNASKVSQREWFFLKNLNFIDISTIVVAQAILEHRNYFEDVSDSIECLKSRVG
ncbi:hypothetical protein C9J48_12195 [Photobacterium profundum]|nr:hypothetical protein C9J48_12195 [Photobacterium profundum]